MTNYLDDLVELFGVSFNKGKIAALDALVHRIFEAVLWQLHQTRGLVQRQAEGEDVGLGELFSVDVISQKFWCHVPTIALFRYVVAKDGSDMPEVANLVRDSVVSAASSCAKSEAGIAARRVPGIGRLITAEVALASHQSSVDIVGDAALDGTNVLDFDNVGVDAGVSG